MKRYQQGMVDIPQRPLRETGFKLTLIVDGPAWQPGFRVSQTVTSEGTWASAGLTRPRPRTIADLALMALEPIKGDGFNIRVEFGWLTVTRKFRTRSGWIWHQREFPVGMFPSMAPLMVEHSEEAGYGLDCEEVASA